MDHRIPDVKALPRPEPIDESQGSAFAKLLKRHKLSGEEYQRLRGILQRAPTMAELGVFSAMWSEHCSYKSSRVHLGRFPTRGPNVVVGPGENAGVVRLSGKLCVAFKMESHNHPSYLEPYQGAATGVGGILRDVFCMGARPVANLNALRFGRRDHPRTRFLVENVVRGIGDYGNCIGVPTMAGNVAFDRSYDGNCLVNAMTVGFIHEDKIFKGYANGPGNLVVYVGSATGRDGVHGATMASGSFESGENSERSAVQVGDPFTEKLLLEATLEALDAGLVVGLQDMGAAGLTSSSFEMAGRAGNGLFIDLSKVPVRTTAMSAYELLLSESQERMLMVVTPDRWPALKVILDRWQLHSAVIGVVTATGRVQAQHEGRLEIDIPVAQLTDEAPRYDRPRTPRVRHRLETLDGVTKLRREPFEGLLVRLLGETGDKTGVIRQYDHHIGLRSVLGPQEQGAAVLWARSEWADPNEPWLGLATAAACNERYCRADARLGASLSVLKAARAIGAVGGQPLAITDCLNYGNPEDPQVMWEFSEGVDGITEACNELGIPVVSGNVSLYNETDGVSIAPTPMIGMVGKVSDVRQVPPAILKTETDLYLLCGPSSRPQLSASCTAKVLGLAEELESPSPSGDGIPNSSWINWPEERSALAFLKRHVEAGRIAAARDVGDGGVATTVAKMVLPTRQLGLRLTLMPSDFALDPQDSALAYFGELCCAYVVAFRDDQSLALAKADLGTLRLVRLGSAEAGGQLSFAETACDRQALESAFLASILRALMGSP